MTETSKKHTTEPWWRGGVIYQIYPRSFMDSDGNGIGDLQGIINQLNYISTLGVDAIWVSPFFKSPMKDFGYDISDYRQVDPLFGSNNDFRTLVLRAHKLNLKVIIDQVPSHTSDQHPWFQESKDSKQNPKSNWYVWADAGPDGQPPNNWLSIFGGSAWQWSQSRCQYYFHNFLTSQPDLNYHCDSVRAQILEEIEFWLKLGVDGVRLDAINYCYHDASLRNNPEKPLVERIGRGFSSDNPYAAQYHYHDNTQPENLNFLEEVRALFNRYPSTVALGEINSEDSMSTLAEYTTAGTRLHMGYSFELLSHEFSAKHIKNTVEKFEAKKSDGWPCWAFSNHDVVRVVSRWGTRLTGHKARVAFAKLLIALLGTLRGTICTYQGEELGLCEAVLEKHQLHDPFGIEFWPEFKGRDGCRTPMPWLAKASGAGFSKVEPWLPIPPEHLMNSVESQQNDPNSVLFFFKSFHRWRSKQPKIKSGSISFPPTNEPDSLLIIQRTIDARSISGYFNLGGHPETFNILAGEAWMGDAPKQLCAPMPDKKMLCLKSNGFAYSQTIAS